MIKRVYFEITNACNLNCSFCTNKKGNAFVEIDKIKNVLTQIKDITDYVYLHVLGEPLLHPNIEEILNYADKLNIKIQLVTNGTLLYKYKDILNHHSIRKLSISLHSVNNIEINNNYFETIKYLIDNNKSKNIELRFYNNDNLDDKLNNFQNKLKTKYDLKPTTKFNSYNLIDNVYIYYENLFCWPKIEDEIISDKGKCHGAIEQIAILHDLKVTTCCLDPLGNNVFGDLNKNTLKEILDGKKYQEISENLKNKKLILSLCKRCKYKEKFN